MNQDQHQQPETNPATKPGQWQRIAQRAWPLLALLSFALLVVTLPGIVRYAADPALSQQGQAPAGLKSIVSVISAFSSLTTAVTSLGLALLLFWRKRDDRMALFLAYFFLLYGIILGGPLESFATLLGQDALGAPVLMAQSAMMAMILVLLYTFPSESFVPSWSRWLVLVAIGVTPLMMVASANMRGAFESPWILVLLGTLLTLYCIGFYSQIYRYRRVSTSRERLQTKWVIYGFGTSLLLTLLSNVPYTYRQALPPDAPISWWLVLSAPIWWLGLAIMPVTFTVAIMRHRLWDIDIIIRRTLIYGLLTFLLTVLYFGAIILLQSMLHALSGQDSPLAIVLSTLIIAAVFKLSWTGASTVPGTMQSKPWLPLPSSPATKWRWTG